MPFSIGNSKTNTLPYRPGGRYPERDPISTREAKRRAMQYARAPLSPLMADVVSALATAGVLTAGQLDRLTGVKTRTLRKYTGLHLLDKLPTMPEYLQERGLPGSPEALRLYCLGTVGLELARLRTPLVPTGYVGSKVDRISHALLCNSAILGILESAHARGWAVTWHSRFEATLHYKSKPVIEPDALLRFERGRERRLFAVEYHHEDSGRRVPEKVSKYVALDESKISSFDPWYDEWQPPVLVIATHQAVHSAYYRHMQEYGSVNHYYSTLRVYGKLWRDCTHPDVPGTRFLDYRTNQWVDVLA